MARANPLTPTSSRRATVRLFCVLAVLLATLFLVPPASALGPGATFGLTGVAGDTTTDLGWNDNENADGWEVHRSTTSGFTPSNATLIAEAYSPSYHDSGLTNGVTYYYKVRAFDVVPHYGSYTGQLALMPVPPAPPAPVLNVTGQDQRVVVNVTFAGSSCWIFVYNGTTQGFPNDAAHYLTGFTTTNFSGYVHGTSYTQTGLLNGHPMYYHAFAMSCWYAASTWGPEAGATPHDTVSPPQVLNLTGEQSNGQVILQWDASPATDLDHYLVFEDNTSVASSPGNSAVIFGVQTGVGHVWTVEAVDTSGNVGLPSSGIPLIGYDVTDPLHTGGDLGQATAKGSESALQLDAIMIPAIIALILIGVIVRSVLQ